MTTTTIGTTALTPDGKQRPFHAGHIKDGRLHGYVYVSTTGASRRVYGSINAECVGQLAQFEPTGANAKLVEGTFPQPQAVDGTVVTIVDIDSEEGQEALASVLGNIADPFALANVD